MQIYKNINSKSDSALMLKIRFFFVFFYHCDYVYIYNIIINKLVYVH